MASRNPRILFVKKLLAGGEPCAKCVEIERRLQQDGLSYRIDKTLSAWDSDPSSAGARLAGRLGVRRAPFFVLRYATGEEQIIESYLGFKRWACGQDTTVGDLTDAVDRHPDLGFI